MKIFEVAQQETGLVFQALTSVEKLRELLEKYSLLEVAPKMPLEDYFVQVIPGLIKLGLKTRDDKLINKLKQRFQDLIFYVINNPMNVLLTQNVIYVIAYVLRTHSTNVQIKERYGYTGLLLERIIKEDRNFIKKLVDVIIKRLDLLTKVAPNEELFEILFYDKEEYNKVIQEIKQNKEATKLIFRMFRTFDAHGYMKFKKIINKYIEGSITLKQAKTLLINLFANYLENKILKIIKNLTTRKKVAQELGSIVVDHLTEKMEFYFSLE